MESCNPEWRFAQFWIFAHIIRRLIHCANWKNSSRMLLVASPKTSICASATWPSMQCHSATSALLSCTKWRQFQIHASLWWHGSFLLSPGRNMTSSRWITLATSSWTKIAPAWWITWFKGEWNICWRAPCLMFGGCLKRAPTFFPRRGLITDLTVNPTESNMERSDACAIFSLHFTLTSQGLNNYQEVVKFKPNKSLGPTTLKEWLHMRRCTH